jgi:hypothetical protein
MNNAVYSTTEQLRRIADIIECCCRLPVSNDAIPGAFLETVFAHVRNADVLATYDYIDVVDKTHNIGWSIKSTKASTPLTWKRAKLPNKQAKFEASHASEEGAQLLGDALIAFCNDHAKQSMAKYGLSEIGYCRLILHDNRQVTYFERRLCTSESPNIFDASEFEWSWSAEKTVEVNSKSKEQLSALHGRHKPSGNRWWAWHGLGENQLHFTGERGAWWPSGTQHKLEFTLPEASSKLSFERLLEVLSTA